MDHKDEFNSSAKHETTESTRKVSQLRSNASQCCAVFASSLVLIETGLFAALASVLIAELRKPEPEIEMSIDDLTWFSEYRECARTCFTGSRYFVTPIGCLHGAAIAHNIGNRSTILLASILYALSCLAFYFAKDATTLLAAQAFNGLILSMPLGPGFAYIVEVAQPHLRSALTASATLLSMTSAFLVVLLSNFLHWRVLALVVLAFPIVGLAAMCVVPESPRWLASKGKFDEARAALSWVRGWTTANNVSSEFNEIKDSYKRPSLNTEDLQNVRWTSRARCYLAETFQPLSQRSFYIPLLSMCFVLTLRDVAGYHALITFCIVIFREIDSPIHPNVAGSLFDAARIVGAIVYILSVNRIGKKKLVYASLILAALSYFVISMALFFREHDVCRWIAAIAMILSTFSTSAGIDKIVMVLNVELFPTKLRNVGSGIGLFVFSVSQSVSLKLFLYLVDILTLPGVFVMFGVATVFNCVVFYVMIPETEGRTLTEIEEHYSGLKKLKD